MEEMIKPLGKFHIDDTTLVEILKHEVNTAGLWCVALFLIIWVLLYCCQASDAFLLGDDDAEFCQMMHVNLKDFVNLDAGPN
jgi:hypothetical protein